MAPASQYNGAVGYPPQARQPTTSHLHQNKEQITKQIPRHPGQQHGVPQRPVRSLNVNEALRFTPLSSILPHDASIISSPNASVSVSRPIFSNSKDEQKAKDQLELLDRYIKRGHNALVRDAVGKMQSLLNPSECSQFMFKKVPPQESANRGFKTVNQLSPFARMVLDHTDIECLFPESEAASSPESTAQRQDSVQAHSPSHDAIPLTPDTAAANQQAFQRNQIHDTIVLDYRPISPIKQHQVQPKKAPPQPISQPAPSNSQSDDRKRKRVEDNEADEDPKAAANANLQELKELLYEITTAENDGSSGELLYLVHEADGDVLTLSSTAHMRLEPAIAHVIKSKRLHVLGVEDLVKLQRLSIGGIAAADGINGRISSDWNESEAENWHADVEILEAAFRSSRTVLRIMSGGRDEKVLYPEELLQKIINLVCKVIDHCVTKVVEARSTGDTAELFEIATRIQKPITHLLQSSSKVLKLLLEVLTKEELSEKPINDVLFFAIRTLFVENSPSEKDSVLGVQKFETFRRTSMNLITKIYSRYEDQRDFILREILDSLQKLPTTKVHARQFKLLDGGRLQLTSVLLLRLVSTSGSGGISIIKQKSRRMLPEVDTSAEPKAVEDSDASADEDMSDEEDDIPLSKALAKKLSPIERSQPLAKALNNAAWIAATKITGYLVTRASTCSKSGEQPYRHLLDMFVEDLITVFNSAEWPASEIVLRALMAQMVDIAEKSPTVSAKNMALETLGTVGTAILATQTLAQQYLKALETDKSSLANSMSNLHDMTMSEGLGGWDLAEKDGPYHVVLEHLSADESDVQGYHLTQWIKLMFWGLNNTKENPEPIDDTHIAFANEVCSALTDGAWISSKRFSISSTQSKFAYQLILLNVGVCKAFSRILNVLVNSVRSDQVTVRARGLKSVIQMIEKDPSMLERMATQVDSLIGRCVGDNSAMVRDNALQLLGKCMKEKSSLDSDNLRSILVCIRDPAPGLKKRAIKLLRDVYLRDFSHVNATVKDYKAVISDYLLQSIVDIEESIAELGRQTLEEIWLMPFAKLSKDSESSVQERTALKTHVNLLTNTLNRSDSTALLARRFLRYSMSEKCKSAKINRQILRSFVAAGFDVMLDEDPEAPSRVAILQTLTVLAQASPRLFTQQQLEHLFQPYVGTKIEAGDVNVFRKVVIILRWVLPTLSKIQEKFLNQVQSTFLQNLTRLTKPILNEVAACLWTINGSVQNLTTLANIELGVLQKLHAYESVKLDGKPEEGSKVQRFMDLAGQFGHFCDLSTKHTDFQAKLNWLRNPTVPAMIIAALRPFSSKQQPTIVQTSALENIGLICEAWPQQFNDPENVRLYQQILRGNQAALQKIVLGCFRNFFASQDAQFGSEEEIEERQVLIDGKIGGSVIASEKDAAAALIAQGFTEDILRIALSSQDDYALAATEVLASILRQGLVHPRLIGPALVALETSTNDKIASIAAQQHATIHTQHESMFDREYMRAIAEAFKYQKTVVKDTRGFVKPTMRAKLHPTYELIKLSKSKMHTKFLSNYLSKIDFDPTKLDVSSTNIPSHLEFARFMLENLAFFEYGRLDDLMQVIQGCEKIVSSTGAAVSDLINRDVLGMIIDPTTGIPLNSSVEWDDQNAVLAADISESRLRLLTTSAVTLCLTWQIRTYLRKLYNIASTQNDGQPGRAGRGRQPKDANKIPPKNLAVSGEKLIETIDQYVASLNSRETSIETCKTFARLMAIDNEVKVPAGDDEDDEPGISPTKVPANGYARKDTPTWQDREASLGTNDGDTISVNDSARKRRGSSTGATPVKKRKDKSQSRRSSQDRRKSVEQDGGFDSIMFD